jgi:hypothetical protein
LIWRHLLPVSDSIEEAVILLGIWRTHAQFQRWLEEKLLSFLPEQEKLIRFYGDILEKVYVLDLDKLLPLAMSRYSFTGRPAKYQPEIFRALVVMTHLKEDAITSFVARLRAHPVLAAVCGFEEDAVSGVGTFYDFLTRFWLGDEPATALREPKRRRKKPKGGEKLPEEDMGRVAYLVNKVMDGHSFEGPETLLQKILTECAVKPSLNLGLCDGGRILAGDGTPLDTGASHLGKRVCTCKERGIYQCSCPRLHTGPTANWGWDSYNERWFYGHTLYAITAAGSFNDLPLLLHLTQASRHDSGTFVIAYAQLRQLYPEVRFKSALLDSAHDAYEIYRLLNKHEIEPFIDLNDRRGQKQKFSAFKVDEHGRPICMAERRMAYNGFDVKRQRIKWRCPLYRQPDRCPNKQVCSPSAYGRVVYTKPHNDFRLFTKTPRDTKAWKKTYARRTTVERTIKRIMVDYAIERLRFRAEKRWFWAASLAAINMHLDAQVAMLKRPLFMRLGLIRAA